MGGVGGGGGAPKLAFRLVFRPVGAECPSFPSILSLKSKHPLAMRPLLLLLFATAVFADGRVVSAPDPNQEQFATIDARFVLQGEGRKGADGVVFGNQNLKIGAPIELEGSNFRVIGSVTGLRLGAS